MGKTGWEDDNTNPLEDVRYAVNELIEHGKNYKPVIIKHEHKEKMIKYYVDKGIDPILLCMVSPIRLARLYESELNKQST